MSNNTIAPSPFYQLGLMNGVLGQVETLTRFMVGTLGCPSQAQLSWLEESVRCKYIYYVESHTIHPQTDTQNTGVLQQTASQNICIHIHLPLPHAHTINTHGKHIRIVLVRFMGPKGKDH
jgi:hypothetical protein